MLEPCASVMSPNSNNDDVRTSEFYICGADFEMFRECLRLYHIDIMSYRDNYEMNTSHTQTCLRKHYCIMYIYVALYIYAIMLM